MFLPQKNQMITPKQNPVAQVRTPFDTHVPSFNLSEMDEGGITVISNNLQSFPKTQFIYQLQQPQKVSFLTKSPLPSHPMLAPKVVLDDQQLIGYAHSKSVQSTPLQQVKGEGKEESSAEYKNEPFDMLSVESRTVKRDINVSLLRKNTKYFQEVGFEKNSIFRIVKEPYMLHNVCLFLDMASILQLLGSNLRFRLYAKTYNKVLSQRIRQGVQLRKGRSIDIRCEQYMLWDYFIGFMRSLQKSNPFEKYSRLASMESSNIQKDIDRTFTEDEYFQNNENKKKLYHILVALSYVIPSVGYVQGLNQIAGVLLIQGLNEQQTFWFMTYLMKQVGMQEMFMHSFKKLKFLNFAVAVFLRNYMPRLSQLFLEHEIDLSYFSTRWLLTLFSFDLPQGLLLKVWNLLILGGWKVLVKTSLAILRVQHDYLVENQLEMDDIYELLKNSLYEYLSSQQQRQDDLMDAYTSHKVTNKLIKQLEVQYEDAQENLTTLEENLKITFRKGKPCWKLNDQLIASRRSLAGSVNDLLASVSSSELNEKVSEERDSPYNSQQQFLSQLFPLIINKGESKIMSFKPTLSQVASEKKASIQINSNDPPQLIQFQVNSVNHTHHRSKHTGSPKNSFSMPFTIPKSSDGDQECNIHADDLQSHHTKKPQERQKGALVYKNHVVAQNSQLNRERTEDSTYQINPESQPKQFKNLIVNSSKSTA